MPIKSYKNVTNEAVNAWSDKVDSTEKITKKHTFYFSNYINFFNWIIFMH